MAGNPTGAVVVTGASTGIGRAAALLLDRYGYRVFAGVRKEADAKTLSADGSDRLTPITIDVIDEKSIAGAKETVAEAVGDDGLVGLVNNAGVGGGGPVEFVPIDSFRRTIEVNVVGLDGRPHQPLLPEHPAAGTEGSRHALHRHRAVRAGVVRQQPDAARLVPHRRL